MADRIQKEQEEGGEGQGNENAENTENKERIESELIDEANDAVAIELARGNSAF